jgi:hypothetical protein
MTSRAVNRHPTAACQEKPPDPEPAPTEPASDPELLLITTGESTRRADRVMGPGKKMEAIDELPAMPELEEIEAPDQEPGGTLRPAVFLSFKEQPRKEIVEAYARMWKKHAGSYEILIPGSQGWLHVLQSSADKADRLACAIDVIDAIRLEEDIAAAARALEAGCADLARELKASSQGKLDAKRVLRLTAELETFRKSVGASVDVQIVAGEQGYRAADVHWIARSLGFVWSDFGSYAWYNESDIGHDILITMRPGDAPYRFDFTDPDKTYSSIGFGFDLDEVPAPHIVMDRLLTAATMFQKHLGGHLVDARGKRAEVAILKARVSKAIGTLKRKGMLVPARVPREQ